MRRFWFSFSVVFGLSVPAIAEVALPEPVDENAIGLSPYSYNGRVYVIDSAYASASLVEDGVMATAAHVVFDEDLDVPNWVPTGNIRYYPQYNGQSNAFISNHPSFIPTAFYRWTTYYPERVIEDDEPGFSSIDTFNVDFAAGFFSSIFSDPLLEDFPEVHVDTVGETGILRDDREMTLIGYPSESPEIPSNEIGLMHASLPGLYPGDWVGIEEISEIDFQFPGGLWYGTYNMADVATYQGGSGGAFYARDDSENWMMTGVLVGGSGSETALVRGIDDNAYAMIKSAVEGRGLSGLKRIEDLSLVETTADSVTIQWTDNSEGEAGYQIFRQDYGTSTLISTIAAGQESFTDSAGILPGHVYHYQVQAITESGNRPPKSVSVSARTSGSHPDTSAIQASQALKISSSGDSSWYLDDLNRLRSGKVRSNGSSSLQVDIIGPGTLSFDWSVSSEENPDYADPQSQYFGQIYDSLYLYFDGEILLDQDEPVFISGDIPQTPYELAVPSGPHQIEWRYQKDPYTSEFEDAGFLGSVDWTPSQESFYPVFGAYELEDPLWHGSTWLGEYYAALTPWIYHRELGWIYWIGGTAEGVFFGHIPHPDVGTFCTSPEVFPFIYLVGLKAWAYYYPESGSFGSGAAFWVTDSGDTFQLP